MTTPDPSREAFEKWMGAANLTRTQFDDYVNDYVDGKWIAWQAAMAHKGADCWQSIETAPKDGERILLSGPTGRIAVGFWEKFDGSWFWPQGLAEPTVWQPLPAAPKQEGSTR